jgi:beta-N-acetylhexosaminidase
VAGAAVATVDGWRAGGVRAIPGHFPGEGGASGDPTLGPATVGLALADLRRADLEPFRALAATAPAIQMSAAMYAAFDGVTPASILPGAVRLLRATGFRGAIVSADLTAVAAATGGSVAEAAVDALRAGCDLVLIPGDAADQDAAWRAVAGAIASGRLTAARVRQAEAHVAALRLAG